MSHCGRCSELRPSLSTVLANHHYSSECDAPKSCSSHLLSTTTCTLCVHLSLTHINAIPLPSSPQPGSTPDLPSAIECIPSRNKSTMYVRPSINLRRPLCSYSTLGVTQIMNSCGLTIQTRQLHRPCLRACATPASMPSLRPTTFSVEDPRHI